MSSMCQGGKVLHLYVEVRSVSEDEDRHTLRSTDILSLSPTRSPSPSPLSQPRPGTGTRSPSPSPLSQPRPGTGTHSPSPSPLSQPRPGTGTHSPSPSPLPRPGTGTHSLSSSRQSVCFQLQSPDATGCPTQYVRQDGLTDRVGQFLDVLAPKRRSLDVDHYQRRSLSSPSSTSTGRRSWVRNQKQCELLGLEDEGGETSVVSFGYIQKSNVHSMAGHRNLGSNEAENALWGPAHLHKRLSESGWYQSLGPLHPQSPGGPPSVQRVSRDATYRALQNFGSPDLRRRFPETYSPSLPRQQPSARCRSWGGSPILPGTARTLPAQLQQADRRLCSSSADGLPGSPASERVRTLSLSRPNQRSPASFHPPLPAGRPTDIQHEAPSRTTDSSPRPLDRTRTGTIREGFPRPVLQGLCGPASPTLQHTAASRSALLDPRQSSSSRDPPLHRYQVPQFTGEPRGSQSRLSEDALKYPQSSAAQPLLHREPDQHRPERSAAPSSPPQDQRPSSPRTSEHARSQRIAQAKWDFLFGRQTGREAPPSKASPAPLTPANQRKAVASQQEACKVQVELLSQSKGSVPKTRLIRTIKYSETDLDCDPPPPPRPPRLYRETDLDQVMRAEAEDSEKQKEEEEEEEEEEEAEEEEGGGGMASWVTMEGDKHRQRSADGEGVALQLRSVQGSSGAEGALKSPVCVEVPLRPSDSSMDSFSRHFENIMESHRAKGTSYSSLDGLELLSSGPGPGPGPGHTFSFDLPTLTPHVQSQICASAKQILELSFAPLVQPDLSDTHTSCSTLALCSQEAGPPGDSASSTRFRPRPLHRDRKASSVPTLYYGSRERAGLRPSEPSQPQPDLTQSLALNSSEEALANGTKADRQAAQRLAARLYSLDGFRKSDVSRHLGKNNDFSQMVGEEYLSNFNFSAMTIDQALRSFLTHLALIGETQERERVLVHFSRRFRHCNPHYLQTPDSVHTLTCALMLLNTDLHGNNLKKRMSCSQFVSNLEGLNEGTDYPKDLLKTLYNSIKNNKLQWTVDEEEEPKHSLPSTDWSSRTMRRSVKGNPFLFVGEQEDAQLYMSGFLVRKVHADPDGRRTPRGKRGWKTFYGALRGLVLYLQKDAQSTQRPLSDEDVRRSVSVHHSLAMKAADYSKRNNVFYLRTADWRVFLLQAPDTEQMQSWITRINLVAASFSAPPFPAAIGSRRRSFSRPLLPGSHSKLSEEDQLKSHQSRFRSVSSDLVHLDEDRKVRGHDPEDQRVHREYLEFERTRYGTYSLLLRAKLQSGENDICRFESLLSDSAPSLQEVTRRTLSSRSLRLTPSKGASITGGGAFNTDQSIMGKCPGPQAVS